MARGFERSYRVERTLRKRTAVERFVGSVLTAKRRYAFSLFVVLPSGWVSRRGGRTALGRLFKNIQVGPLWARSYFQ